MSVLLRDWAGQFRTNLNRHSIVSADRWATEYRVMDGKHEGGPWTFKNRPWLVEMHKSKAPYNVGKKAAQLGYTEAMLNIAFFQMDVENRDVLYLLPNTRPVAADFSMTRVDKAIQLSPHLKRMFGKAGNIGLKIAGERYLYIRGANSKSGLKSIPTGIIIFDEFNEMPRENINLAEERASGQAFTLDWKISTPTSPGFGVDALYEESSKENYFFPCPACSKHIQLTFPDNIVITATDKHDPKILDTHLICGECKAKLPHEGKYDFLKQAKWVPEYPDRMDLMRGFYVNQLYSPTLAPWKIAKLFLDSQGDAFSELEFYNSKLGLAHLVSGAKIDDEMLRELIREYQMYDSCRQNFVTTMGVDIGKVIHVWIDGWDLSKANSLDLNAGAVAQTLFAGEFRHFEQLDELMINYQIKHCVVDIAPDTREAEKFAKRFYGRVHLCRYNSHLAARTLSVGSDNDKSEIYVSVNRTSWLDQSLGRFRNRGIVLPNNLPQDVFTHVKNIVRVPKRDRDGNPHYAYETPASKPDHYAHARNYSEVALPFAVGNRLYVNSHMEM